VSESLRISLVFTTFVAMNETWREKYLRFKEWQQKPHEVKEMSQEEHVCPTCGTQFQGNYCPRCGQSSKIGRYSFVKAFLLFLDVWGLGNRGMFRTLRDLILRPGYMIRDYLQGMQMAYFPPFKMFFLLITLGILVDSGMNIKMENRIEKVQKEMIGGMESAFNQMDGSKTKEFTNDTIDSSNKVYEWTIKHLSLVTIVFLLLFSLPLYLFFHNSPAYPGLKYSEFFVAMIYITNMITIYSIIVSFFGMSQFFDLAIYVLTFIPLKQLSGYSYWRIILNCIVALILFFGAIFVVSLIYSITATFISHL
jgi:hypothetical protein